MWILLAGFRFILLYSLEDNKIILNIVSIVYADDGIIVNMMLAFTSSADWPCVSKEDF